MRARLAGTANRVRNYAPGIVLGLVVVGLPLWREAIASPAAGTLEVRVMASREAIRGFERLDLALARIAIRRSGTLGDEGGMDYAPGVASVNLADQIGGHAATVMREEVPVGSYDAIRIDVGAALGRLRDGRTPRLRIALQPGLVRFEVRPGGTTSVVVDFTVVELKSKARQAFDYEIRVQTAFADPAPPPHSGFPGPSQRESVHHDAPQHGLREHLRGRGE